MLKKSLGLVLMLALHGCGVSPSGEMRPTPGDENYAPPVVEQAVSQTEEGSLFNRSYVMTLFQDRRAYRVGDMLTVVLDEKTTSSKQSSTSLSKNSGTEYDISLTYPVEYVAQGTTAGGRTAAGKGDSSQKNSLSGSITVLVAGVMPNGILQVRGEKWLRLNQGDEFIRLSGLVRVEDIDGMNQISSQRLGDARITYSGRGALANANEAGWLTQFFNSPWFPI